MFKTVLLLCAAVILLPAQTFKSASTTTNSAGNYSINVAAGGNYTVTPSLSGYTFTPPSAAFNNLSANQTANFTAAGAPPAPAFITLASFNGTNGSDPRYFALIQASDGNFYGTTDEGWANSGGTVFQVTPAGVLTTTLIRARGKSEELQRRLAGSAGAKAAAVDATCCRPMPVLLVERVNQIHGLASTWGAHHYRCVNSPRKRPRLKQSQQIHVLGYNG
jgi:uncharacterized repeat protein (TIGR03803 family)